MSLIPTGPQSSSSLFERDWMNRFEEEFETFKKCLRERAALLMKQREEALDFKRRRPKEDAARSAMKIEALKYAGPPLLVGWKEIAQTLGNISIRTAQRWGKCLGLPLRACLGTVVSAMFREGINPSPTKIRGVVVVVAGFIPA
jgi:hypothetical protein